jgi:hypothetical protein
MRPLYSDYHSALASSCRDFLIVNCSPVQHIQGSVAASPHSIVEMVEWDKVRKAIFIMRRCRGSTDGIDENREVMGLCFFLGVPFVEAPQHFSATPPATH